MISGLMAVQVVLIFDFYWKNDYQEATGAFVGLVIMNAICSLVMIYTLNVAMKYYD